MIKQKDGRRLGDTCKWSGETWKLYELGQVYYHIKRITNNGYNDRFFHTSYFDCWTDEQSADGELKWDRMQRPFKQPKKLSSWSLK